MRCVDLHTSFVFFVCPPGNDHISPYMAGITPHFESMIFVFPWWDMLVFWSELLLVVLSISRFSDYVFIMHGATWSSRRSNARSGCVSPSSCSKLAVGCAVSNCSSSLYVTWLPFVPRIELEEQTRMREVAELKKSLEICNWNAFYFSLPFENLRRSWCYVEVALAHLHESTRSRALIYSH